MGHLRVTLCHTYLMINTDNNPFFDQSYCSWQTKQLKNSAFHFLISAICIVRWRSWHMISLMWPVMWFHQISRHQVINKLCISVRGKCYFNEIAFTGYMKNLIHSIDIKKKKIPTTIMSYVVPCCSRKYTISQSGEYWIISNTIRSGICPTSALWVKGTLPCTS
jgi:hypothetical protein